MIWNRLVSSDLVFIIRSEPDQVSQNLVGSGLNIKNYILYELLWLLKKVKGKSYSDKIGRIRIRVRVVFRGSYPIFLIPLIRIRFFYRRSDPVFIEGGVRKPFFFIEDGIRIRVFSQNSEPDPVETHPGLHVWYCHPPALAGIQWNKFRRVWSFIFLMIPVGYSRWCIVVVFHQEALGSQEESHEMCEPVRLLVHQTWHKFEIFSRMFKVAENLGMKREHEF